MSATAPLLQAFDYDEWLWYVAGHDEGELLTIDDLEALVWEKLWMREIPASQAEDYGIYDDGCDETVLRNRETGRFEARTIWIECHEADNGATPWMGVRYAGTAGAGGGSPTKEPT